MMRLKIATNETIMIFLIVLVFVILALSNLNYPGISIDEAGDGIVAGYILKDRTIASNGLTITNYFLILFNRIFPVMTGDYVGAVFSYLVYPFSIVFGLNIISLRVTPICISVLTILFIYFTCKMWFGKRMAFLSILLTATNLVFVQYSRVGLYREEIFIIFFFWAGIFFFIKHIETKRNIFLCISLFVWGLGLSTKITFLLYTPGIFTAYIFLQKRINLSLRLKQLPAAVASFCLGAIFVILYNIKEPFITVKVLTYSLFVRPFKLTTIKPLPGLNISNLSYLTNLKLRLGHLFMLIKGDIVEKLDWGVRSFSFSDYFSLATVVLTFLYSVGTVTFILLQKDKTLRTRAVFFCIIYVITIFVSPFTVSGYHPGHAILFLPFPQIILALFLDYIWQRLKFKKLAVSLIYFIFLFPVLLFNIWMNIYFLTEMKKVGGYGRWSTAIYELADYLDKNNMRPITFGFGFTESISFITKGKIVPIQYDGLSDEQLTEEYWRLSSADEPFYYLAMESVQSEENLSNLDLFMTLVKKDGRECREDKLFFNNAGKPVYCIYKIYK